LLKKIHCTENQLSKFISVLSHWVNINLKSNLSMILSCCLLIVYAINNLQGIDNHNDGIKNRN